MALSFVSLLPKQLRNVWAPFRGWVKDGLSSRKITSLLKKQKAGVRRQTLLDAIRVVKQGFVGDREIRSFGRQPKPPISLIPKAETKLRHRFSYLLDVKSIIDGESVTRKVTLSTDSLFSQNEAIELITDRLNSDFFKYGTVEEVSFVSLEGIRKAF